jgi:hypothetical protein
MGGGHGGKTGGFSGIGQGSCGTIEFSSSFLIAAQVSNFSAAGFCFG